MNYRIFSSLTIGLGLLFCGVSLAQETASTGPGEGGQTFASVTERYSAGSINSTELADQALEDVRRQRASVAAQYAQDEALCYEKFFVTACTDAAKERRRSALKQLETIEVEANAYHRRARVEQRDRALRDRQAKQEAESPERTAAGNRTDEPGAAASRRDIADVESKARDVASVPAAEPTRNYNTERAVQHANDQERKREKEEVEAQKRAKNIRAYEKKQQRALERQREIAARKEVEAREPASKGQ